MQSECRTFAWQPVCILSAVSLWLWWQTRLFSSSGGPIASQLWSIYGCQTHLGEETNGDYRVLKSAFFPMASRGDSTARRKFFHLTPQSTVSYWVYGLNCQFQVFFSKVGVNFVRDDPRGVESEHALRRGYIMIGRPTPWHPVSQSRGLAMWINSTVHI